MQQMILTIRRKPLVDAVAAATAKPYAVDENGRRVRTDHSVSPVRALAYSVANWTMRISLGISVAALILYLNYAAMLYVFMNCLTH